MGRGAGLWFYSLSKFCAPEQYVSVWNGKLILPEWVANGFVSLSRNGHDHVNCRSSNHSFSRMQKVGIGKSVPNKKHNKNVLIKKFNVGLLFWWH
jgi:hypothetical protein